MHDGQIPHNPLHVRITVLNIRRVLHRNISRVVPHRHLPTSGHIIPVIKLRPPSITQNAKESLSSMPPFDALHRPSHLVVSRGPFGVGAGARLEFKNQEGPHPLPALGEIE